VAAAIAPHGETAAFVVLRRHHDPAEWSVAHVGARHDPPAAVGPLGAGSATADPATDDAIVLCLLVALDAAVAMGAIRLWPGPAARHLQPA
jgi:hypothetical protein